MEIGILVAAAVAVATVAAYYYLKSIRESGGKIEGVVIEIEGVMTNGTKDYAEKIEEVLNPGGSGPGEGENPGESVPEEGENPESPEIPEPEGGWPA